jgi:hypothetical protein
MDVLADTIHGLPVDVAHLQRVVRRRVGELSTGTSAIPAG